MFRDENHPQHQKTKRKYEKLRKDPVATRKPDRPISGPGRGGKVGTSLTQHIVKDLIDEAARTEDPREALLKYADEAACKLLCLCVWFLLCCKVFFKNLLFVKYSESCLG